MTFRSLKNTGYTPEQVKALYKETKSLRETGKIVGISYGTVRLIVGEDVFPVGAEPLPYAWEGNGKEHPFKKWQDERLGTLPESSLKISKMYNGGLTRNAIDCYIRRRAYLLKKYIEHFGDLREIKDKTVIDTKGHIINLFLIESYDIEINKYNLVVIIKAVLTSGGLSTIRMSPLAYRDLFKE